jgi:hypothetical protein
MIRDLDFDVPSEEAATELIKLCRAEGWTVDDKTDVFHYKAGVPFVYGNPKVPPYTPRTTTSTVIAHAPGFSWDDDSMEKIHAKAAELAAKVDGECVGGGASLGEDDE